MDAVRVKDTQNLGRLVRQIRTSQSITQDELALTAGASRRFIIELEQGKPTAQIGKVLTVLQTLGIRVDLIPPPY